MIPISLEYFVLALTFETAILNLSSIKDGNLLHVHINMQKQKV